MPQTPPPPEVTRSIKNPSYAPDSSCNIRICRAQLFKTEISENCYAFSNEPGTPRWTLDSCVWARYLTDTIDLDEIANSWSKLTKCGHLIKIWRFPANYTYVFLAFLAKFLIIKWHQFPCYILNFIATHQLTNGVGLDQVAFQWWVGLISWLHPPSQNLYTPAPVRIFHNWLFLRFVNMNIWIWAPPPPLIIDLPMPMAMQTEISKFNTYVCEQATHSNDI